MKNLVKLLPVVAVLSLASCKKDQSADQLVTTEDAVVVDQPTADATLPTVDGATAQAVSGPLTTLALSESAFAFGKVKKGEQVEHVYEVTNTGTNPLIISQVKPGCGCTVPDYTKDPILPGQKGKITLKFDSGQFDGLVNKQAEVFANVEKAPVIIGFSADVQPN